MLKLEPLHEGALQPFGDLHWSSLCRVCCCGSPTEHDCLPLNPSTTTSSS